MKYFLLTLIIIIFYGCSPDEDTRQLPNISIITLSEITKTTASSGGSITDGGGTNITSKGVCWNTSTNPTINNDKTNDGAGISDFTSSLTGLTENTTYYIRAYATNSTGTSYSNELSFTTFRIYDGDITLSTQKEVDDFGAENYCEITGDLIIEGSVENLQHLSNLTGVGNSVFIRFSDVISIEGLQNLSYIGQGLKIWNNTSLNSLEGLEKLTTLRSIELIENSIEDLDALINLTSIEAGLFIDNNYRLTNLDGLINLTLLEASPLSTRGALGIHNNQNLIDFCGLQTLLNNGFTNNGHELDLHDNGYNPSFNEILGGDCAQ